MSGDVVQAAKEALEGLEKAGLVRREPGTDGGTYTAQGLMRHAARNAVYDIIPELVAEVERLRNEVNRLEYESVPEIGVEHYLSLRYADDPIEAFNLFIQSWERRLQGKPQWEFTVRGFKDILSSDADLLEKRDSIVALVRASVWFNRTDGDLAEVLDELADVGHPDIDWDEGYSAERHFNDCLNSIYDIADWDRAWLA